MNVYNTPGGCSKGIWQNSEDKMSESLEKKELETTEEVVEEVVEELPNLEEVKVELKCQKCGAALEEGHMFCPQCGKKVDETPVGKDVMATVTKITDNIKDKVEDEVKKGNKKKLIAMAVGAVVVLVLLFNVFGGGKDFNKMYSDIASNSWCTISSDGTWMKLDTNPFNLDDSHNSTAYYKIKEVNTDLGFGSAVSERMGQTRAIDGMQSESNGDYTVRWTYHPDRGLEATYEIN